MLRSLKNAAVLLALPLAACGDDTTTPPVTGDAGTMAGGRLEIVQGIADGAVLPMYREAAAAATTLREATDAWAASGSEDDRIRAQEAWGAMMAVWQEAEMTQFGPAAAADRAEGGMDLRDYIYSWPIVNRCRVDQELVRGDYADVDAFASEAVNVQGLDALESLLFRTADTNVCAPNSSINTSGSWNGIVSELPMRRAAYAQTLGVLLERRAMELLAVWDDGFTQSVRTAGAGSTVYASAQEALNGISDALFYLDKEVKDMKVAEPAGIAECEANVCPDSRESVDANASIAHIQNNLKGFRRVYLGGEGDDALGFDDLLRQSGAEELDTAIQAAIVEAERVAGELEEDIPTLLAADEMALQPLYDAIKAITDLLKSQFVATLDLELPMRAEGDND